MFGCFLRFIIIIFLDWPCATVVRSLSLSLITLKTRLSLCVCVCLNVSAGEEEEEHSSLTRTLFRFGNEFFGFFSATTNVGMLNCVTKMRHCRIAAIEKANEQRRGHSLVNSSKNNSKEMNQLHLQVFFPNPRTRTSRNRGGKQNRHTQSYSNGAVFIDA